VANFEKGENHMAKAENHVANHPSTRDTSVTHLLSKHSHHQPFSRRRFFQTSGLCVGAVVSGFPWGAGTALAAQRESELPSQLPDFSPIVKGIFGVEVPTHLPIEVDPFAGTVEPAANPSLIWDFDGALGLIEANGVSDNNSEGVARRWACDVRFMTGVFQSRDGRKQRGTFGFT
jgi:hypothetical protein